MEQPVARTPRPSMLTADEVAERLKIKKGSAYEVIRQMNKEQGGLGRVVIRGGLAILNWAVSRGSRDRGGAHGRPEALQAFHRRVQAADSRAHKRGKAQVGRDARVRPVQEHRRQVGQGDKRVGSPRAADNRTPEQNRIIELERENKRLRMEVDVLKQAALIFARK
ncbi:hypothetical protein QP551_04170 [Slackia exigua]|nr:hypothetical protein [Slackia exigua]MDK7723892.1 hypothetical protein [Slackia exigua]MDK7725123.1 hypothetical protein [Slackia exigua]